jgi:D-glycero-D-manno-heptose 1,7-bisphosphate phosphatase
VPALLTSPGAAFLDRDGTINAKPAEGGYVESVEELHLLPGVGSAIQRLNEAGLKVFVVTNQRGIARGRLTVDELERIHSRLRQMIDRDAGARVDDFFYCPHHAGTCSCRKPEPGMFYQAAERWPEVDLGQSAMIGDSAIDMEAGQRLGMTSIRIGVDVPDLAGAVDRLLEGA